MTPEQLRDVTIKGLRAYFDEHPSAVRENIGSMTKRVVEYALREGTVKHGA